MKRIIALFLLIVNLFGLIGCSKAETYTAEPDIAQIRSICNLATLKCYYHNVAKSTKSKNAGLGGWFEEERKFWIEYTGVAKIGIDMSKVNMEISEDVVTIHMPQAVLLSVNILDDDLDKQSYIANDDSWLNKNKITAEDQTNAINNAQSEMVKAVEENTTLLLNARIRAEKLIENYILKIGEITGKSYQIKWSYEEGVK